MLHIYIPLRNFSRNSARVSQNFPLAQRKRKRKELHQLKCPPVSTMIANITVLFNFTDQRFDQIFTSPNGSVYFRTLVYGNIDRKFNQPLVINFDLKKSRKSTLSKTSIFGED